MPIKITIHLQLYHWFLCHWRNWTVFGWSYWYDWYLFGYHLVHYHSEVFSHDLHISAIAWHPTNLLIFSYPRLFKVSSIWLSSSLFRSEYFDNQPYHSCNPTTSSLKHWDKIWAWVNVTKFWMLQSINCSTQILHEEMFQNHIDSSFVDRSSLAGSSPYPRAGG